MFILDTFFKLQITSDINWNLSSWIYFSI